MRKKRKLRARAAAEAAALAGIAGDRVEVESEAEAADAAADAGEEIEAEGGVELGDDADGEGDIDVDEVDGAAAGEEDGDELGQGHGQGQGHGELDHDADLDEVQGTSPARLKVIVESLLFAAEKPLTPAQLKQLTGERDGAAIQAALDALMEDYRDRGIVLHDVAGGYQFRTHPTSSEYVQRLIAGRPVRLSRAQLETLAIIAYRQPVTRPEIDEIRGVDCGSTLKVLLDRDLIRVLGKKEEPGRPLLYGTTKDFLEFFNLRDLRELPTLREFHELSEESLREVEKLDQTAAPGGDGPDSDGDDEGGEGEGGAGHGGADGGGAGEAGAGQDVDSRAEGTETEPAADGDEDDDAVAASA